MFSAFLKELQTFPPTRRSLFSLGVWLCLRRFGFQQHLLQLQLVNECSGFVQVPVINAGEEKKLLQAEDGEDIEITKSGYIYIFVSNSSNKPMRFDDLFVKRKKSALVE